MSKISKEKEEKIKSDIISVLYDKSPQALYTAEISRIIARDEEFIKRLLHNLTKKEILVKVTKSPKGTKYLRRERWRLTNKAFKAYSGLQ